MANKTSSKKYEEALILIAEATMVAGLLIVASYWVIAA